MKNKYLRWHLFSIVDTDQLVGQALKSVRIVMDKVRRAYAVQFEKLTELVRSGPALGQALASVAMSSSIGFSVVSL